MNVHEKKNYVLIHIQNYDVVQNDTKEQLL